MSKVRLGVIGCGSMAQNHMENFEGIKDLEFTAAADSFPDSLKAVTDKFGVKGFDDGHAMITSGECDAIMIVTPHYFHPEYAIAGFENGLHVMTEKPVAVTAKAAAEMNAAADAHPELMYGAMFQNRITTVNQYLKNAIESGMIGQFRRVYWNATYWFRTQVYYDSGSWRATWKGEGGGVLLNQCPHDMDLLYWLFGLPSKLTSKIGLGKYHNIEVEDEVTTLLEYPNGATGVFITSTGEKPGSKTFEIVGDRGSITLENEDTLVIKTLNMTSSEAVYDSPERFGVPDLEITEARVKPANNKKPLHQVALAKFIDAIVSKDASKMLADGRDGLYSLEMINGMIMSGINETPVTLPTDHDAYDTLLKDLIAKSDRS